MVVAVIIRGCTHACMPKHKMYRINTALLTTCWGGCCCSLQLDVKRPLAFYLFYATGWSECLLHYRLVDEDDVSRACGVRIVAAGPGGREGCCS
jgi:hypothetical protein